MGSSGWKGAPRRLEGIASWALALAAVAACLGGCGGGGATMDDTEYARRFRLGVDAILRQRPETARAELERCAEARDDDNEVLFQLGRLELLPGEGGEAAARELFERLLERDPKHPAAHRVLLELDLDLAAGAPSGAAAGSAAAHRSAFEAAYGPLGALELAQEDRHHRVGEVEQMTFQALPPQADRAEEYHELVRGFTALQRAGSYKPKDGVRTIEEVLAAEPDLVAVRIQYVRMIDLGQVRIASDEDPSLPVISSKVMLDRARNHLEHGYSRVAPTTRLATEILRALGRIALQQGEYDDAVVWSEIALADTRLADVERGALLSRQGVARYKQARFEEAEALFEQAVATSDERADRWLLQMTRREMGTGTGTGTATERDRPAFVLRPDLEVLAPGATPDFVDAAKSLGIDRLNGLGPTAWSDVDHDGDLDLFTCGCDTYGVLLRDDGERFEDISRAAGLERVQSGFSATFADVDDDGFADIYIGRDGWNGPAPDALWHHAGLADDGVPRYVDVSGPSGMSDEGSSFVHNWSDVDRDGDVDLLLANGITGAGDTNELYLNDGKGVFKKGTDAAGLREKRGTKTIAMAVGDYDDDGWPDVFCSGYQTTNRLYRNRGDGTFEERAKEAGILGADHVSTGYVSFFVDVDNDLDIDLFRTSLAQWDDTLLGLSAEFAAADPARLKRMAKDTPRLYRNRGDGTFSDETAAVGLVHPMGIMGAGAADLDNDGFIDFYLGTGDPQIGRLEPDRYLHNEQGAAFRDLTFATGLGALGKGHGVTFLDRDGDGDLEIYAQLGGFVHGDAWRNAFYVNGHAHGSWLHVLLEGVESNRDAIDAKVIVTTPEHKIVRERKNGEGFGSTNSPALEFGLGESQSIERVEIRWPSGAVQVFDDVPINARIFVREREPWKRR